MEETVSEIKKWGNSLGIVIPKSSGLKPGQRITFSFRKVPGNAKAGEIFGIVKAKVDVATLMRTVDEELWGV